MGPFTQIQADFPDEGLGYYAFTYEDQVYITYYNFFNFLYTLKVINGDVVEDGSRCLTAIFTVTVSVRLMVRCS
jgi:hypothetical protein